MSWSDKEKPLEVVSPEAKVPATDESNQRFRKETERAITEWDEKSQDANTYFIDWINKLLSDRYSKKDCEQFLDSFFSKNPKLDKNSLYWLKYFCNMKDVSGWSYFEKHIDVFSDIPLEDLLMTGRVNETILDKINFSYDSVGFDLLKKAGLITRLDEYDNYKCEKWHDLTKEQVMRLAQREVNYKVKKAYGDRKSPDTQYLSLLKEWEIDEEIIYYFYKDLLDDLFWDFMFYHDVDDKKVLEEKMSKIKELLDKYNIDYIKFCKLLFIWNINNWKKEVNFYESHTDFAQELHKSNPKKLLDYIQEYLNETEVDGFFPKNIAEILDNDKDIQLLIKNNAVDIMNYCDNVECDIQFSEIWHEQPFVIGVNPTEKKIKLFSRDEKEFFKMSSMNNLHHDNYHYLPEGVGFSIVWWWFIKKWWIRSIPGYRDRIYEDEIEVDWSSKNFWGFQEYWGLIYRVLKKNFPGKSVYLRK